MAPTETLEREAQELRDKIRAHKAAGASKREEAEKLLKDEKAKRPDLLTDTSDEAKDAFARIDAAYPESDSEFETAAELENRLHRILDHSSKDTAARHDDPSH